QLEAALRDCRCVLLALLLSALWRNDPHSAGDLVPQGSASDDRQETADHLGSPAGTSLQTRAPACGGSARCYRLGVSAGLCARAQPGRIHLGIPQAARHAELLRSRPRPSGTSCTPTPAFDAATLHAGVRLLASGGTVLKLSCTYASLNSCSETSKVPATPLSRKFESVAPV